MSSHLLLFGPPGSGKSTQGAILSEKLGVPHFSVGALLRELADQDNDLGRSVDAKMSRGEMVEDDIVLRILLDNLSAEGFVLDGFPRTEPQLPLLEQLVEAVPIPSYSAIDISVPPEISRQRLLARGRDDDTPEVIRKRIEAYMEMASPLLRYFEARDNLVVVDGTGDIEEVAARISQALLDRKLNTNRP